MFCPQCGNNTPDGSTLCEACGAAIPSAEAAAPEAPYSPPAAPAVSGTNYPFGSISDAWQLVSKDMGNFILATLIVFIANFAISACVSFIIAIPSGIIMGTMMHRGSDGPGPLLMLMQLITGIANGFISTAVSAPFYTGYAYYILKKVRGQNPELGDVFAGFTKFLVPSILTGLVVSFATSIGMIFCIIPGVVIAIICMFSYLIVADGETQFMTAIMKSKELVMKNFGNNALFAIVNGLLAAAGVIACGVGLLVTGPLAMSALALVYDWYRGESRAAYTS